MSKSFSRLSKSFLKMSKSNSETTKSIFKNPRGFCQNGTLRPTKPLPMFNQSQGGFQAKSRGLSLGVASGDRAFESSPQNSRESNLRLVKSQQGQSPIVRQHDWSKPSRNLRISGPLLKRIIPPATPRLTRQRHCERGTREAIHPRDPVVFLCLKLPIAGARFRPASADAFRRFSTTPRA